VKEDHESDIKEGDLARLNLVGVVTASEKTKNDKSGIYEYFPK
jgi:hypothetical protein